jgi:ribosome biogenesis GTPase
MTGDTHPVSGPEGIPLQGSVYSKELGEYHVAVDGRLIACALSSRLRKELVYPTADPHSVRRKVQQVKALKHVDPLAIGDQVRLVEAGDGTGLIVERLPRRNQLSRRSAIPMPGAHTFEQVVVANVDLVVAVFAAAQPQPKWNLLDRYLAAAEAHDLPALVCITKLDLARDEHGRMEEELAAVAQEYRRIGYDVILTSAVTGEGLEALREMLRGRLSVAVGKSGVGKSTLLNALQPGLGLRVNPVNTRTGKGVHTTTNLQTFPLESGGALVDTPGAREFGLWDVHPDELAWCFPEIRPYLGQCRFGLDCSHDEEPGCAVRRAVVAGQISARRYRSYLRLKVDA